jgi:hypothetical protein
MGPEIAVPVAFFATCFAIPVGIKYISYKQSQSRGTPESAAALTTVEQRLARVEVALDDLTTEMARVAEGQQFLTKVLVDRPRDAVGLPVGDASAAAPS